MGRIGPGIQSKVAISSLSEKQFVIFAVKVLVGDASSYVDALTPFDGEFASANIFSVLDGPTWKLSVDFDDPDSRQRAIEFATARTEEVEKVCPWAAKFGVSGLGEGIVWTPVGKHWGNSDLYFKTKGDQHKGTRSTRSKPSMDPETLSGAEAFVEFSATEVRLEQGLQVLREQGLPVSIESTGPYLKWVQQDILRECALELAASGLEWKQVQSKIQEKSRLFLKRAIYAQDSGS